MISPRQLAAVVIAVTIAAIPARVDAGALSVQPSEQLDVLEQRAYELNEAGRHMEAARAWAEIAGRQKLGAKKRAVATLRTVASAKRAHETGGDAASLCLARATVHELLDRQDTRVGDVEFFRGQADELEHELASAFGQAWRTRCDPPPPPAASPVCVEQPEDSLSDVSCQIPAPDPSVRRLTIAGATTLSLGAAAFAGMGWTLGGAHRRVDQLDVLTAEAAKNGGATDTMIDRATELHDEAKLLTATSVSLGVLGGASVVAGVVMIALGQRRSRNTLTLAPVATPRFGGFTITGRF